jgi:hypothetical protein
MAPLSERQLTAQALADSLGGMPGVYVWTPLPLDPDAKGVLVHIEDEYRDRVIKALCEAHWLPSYKQLHSRITPKGVIPAALYEIAIEKERPPIPAETKEVPRDFAAEREVRKEMEKEVELMRKTIRGL